MGHIKTRSVIVPKARQVDEGEVGYDMNFDVFPKRLWKSGNLPVEPPEEDKQNWLLKEVLNPSKQVKITKFFNRFWNI